MIIEMAGRSDIGIRETNDDRVMFAGEILDGRSYEAQCETPTIAVVCDGCGGYNGGNIASQTVMEKLQTFNPAELKDEDSLMKALDACNKAIAERKIELPQYNHMCTTIAGIVFTDSSTIFFHSGDSRIYRFDGRRLARMTRDHSQVQGLVDAGMITEDQVRTYPGRNVINRCLGIDCPPPDIDVSAAEIREGDMYFICSDGCWEALENDDIIDVLSQNITLLEKAEKLVKRALEYGSDDNTSVCLCYRPGDSSEEDTSDDDFELD